MLGELQRARRMKKAKLREDFLQNAGGQASILS